MVAPIWDKTPVTQSLGVGVGSSCLYRKRTAQARPYNLDAPYFVSKRTILAYYSVYPGVPSPCAGYSPWYTGIPRTLSDYGPDSGEFLNQAQAINKARESFFQKARAKASVGVTLAEGKQAINMITQRASQLVHVVRAIRKGRFGDALYVLDDRKTGRKLTTRGKYKQSANTFLEWHFGWVPFAQDIYNAAEVLSSAVPDVTVKGRGKSLLEQSDSWTDTYSEQHYSRTWMAQAYVEGYLRTTNPNLGLLTQLGLTNPFLIAWELVPFSFVVDWFANVGEFLGQFDELHGITFDAPHHGVKNRVLASYDYYNAYLGSHELWKHMEWSGVYFERKFGIPSVELGLRPMKAILSPTRAVTSVSLLVQQLSRLKGF